MSNRAIRVAYHASFQPFERQGRLFAKIYVIDPNPNLNRWRVTPEAQRRALESLLDAPLLGPPPPGQGGQISGGPPGSPHEGLWNPVGRFVGVEGNGAVYGIAEITDPYGAEMIRKGEWKAVSPSILVYAQRKEDGVDVVDDFKFEHVLFVEKPAIPAAGVKGICEAEDPGFCTFSQSLQAALQARAFVVEDEELGALSRAVKSARGILESIEKKLELLMYGLGLSQGREERRDVGSSLPEPGTQDPEKKPEEKGGGMEETKAPATLQAADAWDTADAPDEFFAYVPPEAKGPEGKKSLRKLPLASIQKRDYDPAIVRNALARFSQTDLPPGARREVLEKICRVAKRLGIESELCERELGAKRGERMEERIRELEESNKQLQAKVEQLAKENEELKAWKAEVLKRERMAKIADILELRKQAGLSEIQIEELEKMSCAALDRMRADLAEVAKRVASAPGPKAKFQAAADELSGLREQIREELFGYRKEAK